MKKFSSLCVAVIAASSVANAEQIVLTATLSGDQEVPAVNTPAFGSAVAIVDTVTNSISITGNYNDLIGINPFGHLHGFAPAGTNVGVLFNLTLVGGAPSGTFSGMSTLTPTQIQQTLDGLTYINIHSNVGQNGGFPSGEIRGQLLVPEPSSLGLVAGASILALRRRRSA